MIEPTGEIVSNSTLIILSPKFKLPNFAFNSPRSRDPSTTSATPTAGIL